MLFDIERTAVPGQTVLRVVGELDLTTAPALTEAAMAELVLQPPRLVVDLSPTTFMDSSGARALVQLGRQARSDAVELLVACPRENSPVRLVVDLLELRVVVSVVDAVPRTATGRAGGDDGP